MNVDILLFERNVWGCECSGKRRRHRDTPDKVASGEARPQRDHVCCCNVRSMYAPVYIGTRALRFPSAPLLLPRHARKAPRSPPAAHMAPCLVQPQSHYRCSLFTFTFCPAPRLLQRRFELLCSNHPRSTLGMCVLRHIRPIRPKYRILDLAIYVDLIGHPGPCPGNPTLFVCVFLDLSTYPSSTT